MSSSIDLRPRDTAGDGATRSFSSERARRRGEPFIHILLENLPILTIVFVYIIAGYLIQIIFDVSDIMRWYWGNSIPYLIGAVFSILYFSVQAVRRKIGQYANVETIGGAVLIVVLMTPFISTFASIKQSIPNIKEFSWDETFMLMDRILHFGYHPWELLWPILGNEIILRSIDFLYILWFPILFSFCFWMAWTSRRDLRMQFFVSMLIVWTVFGSFMGTLFSSAGPCYFSGVLPDAENPYESLMAALHLMNEKQPLLAVFNQNGLWAAKISNTWLPFGGISAMPSIHVAMAVVFALSAWARSRRWGLVFVGYLAVVQVGSVVLGWHYAVDGYVSMILTVLLWKAAGLVLSEYRFLRNSWVVGGRDERSSTPNECGA